MESFNLRAFCGYSTEISLVDTLFLPTVQAYDIPPEYFTCFQMLVNFVIASCLYFNIVGVVQSLINANKSVAVDENM